MTSRRLALLLCVLTLALVTGIGVTRAAASSAGDEPTVIHVEARQFSYSPGVIRVGAGSRVRIELASQDATHGLNLDEYGVSLQAIPGKPASAEFTASRPGRYRIYCNTTCGQLHPFMVGELVVEPNWPLYLGLGLLPLAAIVGLVTGRTDQWSPRWELTAWAPLRRLLISRTVQQGAIALLLAGLTLAALVGLFGSPVGSHNFAIIFVWIVWWGILKFALIPFGGRSWCAVCPLPAPGEWLQRRAIVSRGPLRSLGLGRAWPRRMRGSWLAVGVLLAIGVASAPILTRPAITGWFLAGLAGLGLVLAMVFRGRAFCRYVCPVGGFIGLYSLSSPVALRVKDPTVCASHAAKECIRGSVNAYGCPWDAYPGSLTRNVDCGLCFECLRSCPKGNVALYARPFGQDLTPGAGASRAGWPRLDEGFGAIVMLALAGIYSAVFLGPWGGLKQEALLATPADTVMHSLLIIGGAAVVAPAAWLGVAAVARRFAGRADVRLRAVWAGTATAFVPLGLMAWVAFTASFVLGAGGYVASVVTDPLGWGWDLLALGAIHVPAPAGLLLWLQIAAWIVGLVWATRVGRRASGVLFGEGRSALLASVAVAAGLSIATGGLVWLGLG